MNSQSRTCRGIDTLVKQASIQKEISSQTTLSAQSFSFYSFFSFYWLNAKFFS